MWYRFNGNLSTGDFLFDLAIIALVLVTGGGSLLPKGGKILAKFSKLFPKLKRIIKNSKFFSKILVQSNICFPWRIMSRN